jgi:hypothetical protein
MIIFFTIFFPSLPAIWKPLKFTLSSKFLIFISFRFLATGYAPQHSRFDEKFSIIHWHQSQVWYFQKTCAACASKTGPLEIRFRCIIPLEIILVAKHPNPEVSECRRGSSSRTKSILQFSKSITKCNHRLIGPRHAMKELVELRYAAYTIIFISSIKVATVY